MFKVSKLTDYAFVMLEYVERSSGKRLSTREIAEGTGVPAPTVAKILKLLAKAEILTSQQGSSGGYSLARDFSKISAWDIVSAIEGNVAIVECLKSDHKDCQLNDTPCRLKKGWSRINRAIKGGLQDLSLTDMIEE